MLIKIASICSDSGEQLSVSALARCGLPPSLQNSPCGTSVFDGASSE
jgi:hypothetical protein